MKPINILGILLFSGLTFGCATVPRSSPVLKSSPPAPNSGYVYGRFTTQANGSSAGLRLDLNIVNTDSGKQIAIRLPKNHSKIVVASLPPGNYQIKNTLLTGIFGTVLWRRDVKMPAHLGAFGSGFHIEDGKAYYLGDCYGVITTQGELNGFRTWAGLERCDDNYEKTTEEFLQEYVGLGVLKTESIKK